uniref:Uncharacterized protein n=1 Tax=Salix viminalis TaxID=40686 RepID=A0A6N2MB40_SALVM
MMISRGGEYLKTFCSFVESGQGKDTCLGDHLILEHLTWYACNTGKRPTTKKNVRSSSNIFIQALHLPKNSTLILSKPIKKKKKKKKNSHRIQLSRRKYKHGKQGAKLG